MPADDVLGGPGEAVGARPVGVAAGALGVPAPAPTGLAVAAAVEEEKSEKEPPTPVALLPPVGLVDALAEAVGSGEGVAPLLALLPAVAVAGAVKVPCSTLAVVALLGETQPGEDEDTADAVLAGLSELAWRAEGVEEAEPEGPALLVEDADAKGEREDEGDGVALGTGVLPLEPVPDTVAALAEGIGEGVISAVPPALLVGWDESVESVEEMALGVAPALPVAELLAGALVVPKGVEEGKVEGSEVKAARAESCCICEDVAEPSPLALAALLAEALGVVAALNVPMALLLLLALALEPLDAAAIEVGVGTAPDAVGKRGEAVPPMAAPAADAVSAALALACAEKVASALGADDSDACAVALE